MCEGTTQEVWLPPTGRQRQNYQRWRELRVNPRDCDFWPAVNSLSGEETVWAETSFGKWVAWKYFSLGSLGPVGRKTEHCRGQIRAQKTFESWRFLEHLSRFYIWICLANVDRHWQWIGYWVLGWGACSGQVILSLAWNSINTNIKHLLPSLYWKHTQLQKGSKNIRRNTFLPLA